jgi:hypothetical protein
MTSDEALDAIDRLGNQALHVFIIMVRNDSFQVACDHCRERRVLYDNTASIEDVVTFARVHIKCRKPKQ